MIIYEVNLTVEPEIADGYGSWLEPHIEEILGLPGFEGGIWLSRDPEAEDPPGRKLWTIQYFLKNRKSLDDYLQQHAPRFRKQALDRFGDKFQAKRRVLELVESIKK